MDSGGVNAVTVANNVWSTSVRNLTAGPLGVSGAGMQAIAVAAGINLAATGTTAAVNFSSAGGAMVTVSILITVNATGTPSGQIEIVADGTTFVIPVWVAALIMPTSSKALADNFSGNVNTIGDFWTWHQPIQFNTSLIVRLNMTVAATAGNADLRVIWSHS